MNPIQIYHRTKKLRDLPWNSYVCRPLGAVLVWWLAKTRITPNQVTLMAVVVCAASAGLMLFVPGTFGLVLAIGVYQLSYILDCVDGMLARLRNVQSIQGHLLDFLMDELKAFMVLAAVTVRLFWDRADPNVLLLGLFGLMCLASGIGMTSFLRRPEIAPAAPVGVGERSLSRRVVGLAETLGHWLIHYPSYIWIGALLGKMELYLYPYVAVNALYAGRAFLGIALRFGKGPASSAAHQAEPLPPSADASS
ncbi:MAG: CDP-alcohol phosphatidyltransferase family protein [Polyangiaceae bacterium]|nr:CDP-alcohol phosphatidyltransferase family protein [Polyangiaceae bacterium]